MKYTICALLLIVALAQALPALGPPQDQEIDRAVTCKLPLARGHCRALLPRWRYDPEKGTCQQFKFGGCDGNGNNFITEKQCMVTCGGV